ncbi:Calpain family cysteine protease [Phytophthora infestans]|uniref:Calpain family cysteine protease n=1 Tax=Phytophthora infestans TaxID=4787 RepID=A0A833SBI2_PHYIN|nr:Calpain family cysteine protease [Phytophthora infestans]
MPPKKPPSKLTAQGSTLNLPPTANNYRQPLPAPILPPSDSIPPLWRPNAVPTEVFPEWTDPTALPADHWGTAEQPFEDSLTPENLLLPKEVKELSDSIMWKRPSQFLPVIVDPVIPATPPPPTPEPKAAGKKGAASAARKGEPEPPKRPPPPQHAHVFILKSERVGITTSSSTLPSTTEHHHNHTLHIPRDFQRRWSAEQIETLQAWAKEEERIVLEQRHRERMYMGFEDAIAYIVNERPRDLLAEVDFDADDLVDDGQDEDDALTINMDVSNATSPWGVMPPPRIEIAPNAVYKPEIPHGDIIHANMASYFRIVEQLYSSRQDNNSNMAPFLWQAIYPQDNSGKPVYNPGGKYCVKLYVLGRWRRVDVDDKLPIDADGNVIYLSSSVKSEIWPCLLVKALCKVAYWLHPQSPEPEAKHQRSADGMCQNVVQILLALTSWKVSRWEPKASFGASENVFHQLLQFVPSSQRIEENTEAIAGSEAPATVTETLDKPTTVNSPVPQAVICCAGVNQVADMVFGEVVLVTDVVGDTGNTTFKVVRQGSPATISEETNGVNELVFLLVHPVLQYSDTFIRGWLPNPEPVVEGVEEARAELVPFETPRVQFVVISRHDAAPDQSPGDSLSDTAVNLVASLTSVQPPEQELYNLNKSSAVISTHLGVDPSGSLILIEEMDKKASSTSSLPAILTLNSTYSEFIRVSPVDKGNIVYRVYPQKSLRYGYSIHVESSHKVAFQDAPTYWRSLSNLHVIECDGVHPVMLPGTWNILFKQSFELVPSTQGDERSKSAPELRIDLHLVEELLANFTHISIVNDATGEVKRAGTLCSKITLPVAASDAPIAYTLVVDCAPGNFYVREGKWKLTLASDWEFSKSTTHQMKLTQYEGVYEPNKPLLCFRDVIMAPKTSIWTSFHFQLLRDGAVESALAAKLEVYDLGSNSARIGEKNFKGEVRLLQLPCVTTADGNPPSEDKRGYIIQGSIDRATCIVPDEVQSRRPCRSHSNRPLNDLTTTSVEGNSDVPPPGSARSSRAHCDIKWRLTCWSSEDVKLQEDNTKELQFEAIRASWAEKAVDRNTNGAVSRLLYLGKVHEAEVRMKQDNMMDEQIAKVKSRFEWIQAVKAKITSAGVNESYLEEAPGSDEKLLSEDELTESKRLLLERIGAVEADKEQRRVARALAKEKRAQELKNIVRAVIDRRASSLKKQQELKRQLAAALTQSA